MTAVRVQSTLFRLANSSSNGSNSYRSFHSFRIGSICTRKGQNPAIRGTNQRRKRIECAPRGEDRKRRVISTGFSSQDRQVNATPLLPAPAPRPAGVFNLFCAIPREGRARVRFVRLVARGRVPLRLCSLSSLSKTGRVCEGVAAVGVPRAWPAVGCRVATGAAGCRRQPLWVGRGR